MFSDHVIHAAMQHARDEYPRESCGLVVDGAYVPRMNTAEDPLEDFRISPQGYAAAARKGTVQGVIHSHPDKPDHPSRADMLGQIESGLAWGIVPFGKGWPALRSFGAARRRYRRLRAANSSMAWLTVMPLCAISTA